MYKIGQFLTLKENAEFSSIKTGKTYYAKEVMSDEIQGEWADGPHPYEDDPMIIQVEAFILSNILEPMIFTDTNQEITAIAWSNPEGEWFTTQVENVEQIN